MVNFLHTWLLRRGIKIVFDADGLPLQERVDFLGRNPEGTVLSWLKKQETYCLKSADRVLTRSQKAIDIHLITLRHADRSKFFVISNGRNPTFFTPDAFQRKEIREQMGVGEGDCLWIYSGTLGPEYELADMLSLFSGYRKIHSGSQFLILTRNLAFFQSIVPEGPPHGVTVKQVSFEFIPRYLSAADIGISLRKPAKSLAGLAPIKLGEYLIMGLPVVSTVGIGDSEKLLVDKSFCYLYGKENGDPESLFQWIADTKSINRSEIRDFGIRQFGLQNSIRQYLEALEILTPQ